jgi:hypothetical protein
MEAFYGWTDETLSPDPSSHPQMTWERTGSVDPHALVEARLQLHRAARAVASIGATLNTPRADHSHTSFTWSATLDALMQEPVRGVTCGLRLRDLTVIAIGKVATKFALRGRTPDDALAFLESRLGETLQRPHDVTPEATFDADDDHLRELARYYHDAALVLADVARSDSRACAVRCWPHHFDIATLITLSGHGENARTIGVGFSPGDATFDEPYYYVTPWPPPDRSSLPDVLLGRWNTIGWTGLIFSASSFAGITDQEATVRRFLTDAKASALAALA